MRPTLLILLGLLLPGFFFAQIPTIQGRSTAHAGMMFYDIDQANDHKQRQYVYTIQPDSASCLQFDYTHVKGPEKLNYISVHEGEGTEGPLIMLLGGETKSRLFQSRGASATVKFIRGRDAIQSTWTLAWRSDKSGDCIQSGARPDSCPEMQTICGPTFIENFHHFGSDSNNSSVLGAACIDKAHHSSWYKFVAQKEGDLQFNISPRNGLDDYDWVLWQVPGDSAPTCPNFLSHKDQRACNHAAGRGSLGTTGMDETGASTTVTSTGNPFSRTIPAQKGDVFFLLVDDYSQHSQGFKIDFNDVVLQCHNPRKDFLPLGHKPVTTQPKVPKRNQFSRYSRILRIDLDEKANHALRDCKLDWNTIAALPNGKTLDGNGKVAGPGMAGLILTGLKYGMYPAFAAHDHATPVHFGDILKIPGGKVNWNGSADAFSGFNQVVELIVDEIFDRTTGRKTQQIRMVRLVWAGVEAGTLERNVALFQFEDLIPLLDRIVMPNPHNEASETTALDYLKGQWYTAINISQRSKPNRSLGEAAFERAKEIEFEHYRWDN